MSGASMQIPFGNSESRRLQFGGPSIYDLGEQRSDFFVYSFERRFCRLGVHNDDEIESLIQQVRNSCNR